MLCGLFLREGYFWERVNLASIQYKLAKYHVKGVLSLVSINTEKGKKVLCTTCIYINTKNAADSCESTRVVFGCKITICNAIIAN